MRRDRFSRLAIATLINVFVVVMFGAIVRTTGAGMGCPDWPKCFGQYIPPTDISQLPPDYKTRFAVQNREIADFDAFKTWTEYINRLAGASLGILVLAQFAVSLRLRQRDAALSALCGAMLVCTALVGWLGSVMVVSDLEPIYVTAHMVLAVLVVALSIMIIARIAPTESKDAEMGQINVTQFIWLRRLVYCAIFLTLVQFFGGTRVREEVDFFARTLEGRARDLWIEQLSWVFKAHRSLSLLVLAVNSGIVFLIFRAGTEIRGARLSASTLSALRRYAVFISVCVLSSALTGVAMAYFAIPRSAQAPHILLPHLTFAAQFGLLLALRRNGKTLVSSFRSNDAIERDYQTVAHVSTDSQTVS